MLMEAQNKRRRQMRSAFMKIRCVLLSDHRLQSQQSAVLDETNNVL
jgi:hypothetical protein